MTAMKSIILLSLPLALAKGSQKPIVDDIPRGINPSFIDKYRPDSESLFSCLKSGDKIPFSLVNDDFCDCPDGSDEPGTAACSHLNHSVNPLPGFYCPNKGHIPAYIPFSRINDGICDYDVCCDGSDEWMGVGGVKCPDMCDSIGKEARKAAEEARRLYESGIKAYKQLVDKAGLMRKEMEDKLVVLDGEIIRAQGDVDGKKRILEEAEVAEKSKVASSGAGKGKNAQLVDFAKGRVEELKETLMDLKAQRDEIKDLLKKTEGILETFKEEYNPNFNDEGVKRAVKSWEDYLAVKPASDSDDFNSEHEMQQIINEEIDWEDWATPDESSIIEEVYQIEAFLPPFLRSWVHAQLDAVHAFLVENNIVPPRKTPTDATSSVPPHIRKLQDELSDAETHLKNKQSDLDNVKSDLEKDYGQNSVFRALKDQCAEASSGEYTYSYCHLDKATQKNRDGGSTHLGNWVGFEKRFDDDIEKDVIVIKYERGTRCWNGPERSAYVYLRCSAEEKLISVVEAEKCVYKFIASSPAVCGGDVQ